ncbi:thermonuclease family protein [Bradyrhizobium symbiodeficiens]|uniref:thermonuclease family protein n=1 Tax=Bradyrhizobium symbiodeficiens TaxID=1404367 RepID=UPI000BA19A3F|nr:thermonuclease family protein [Bradyrhizobium symbiodeficiens]AWM06084.1 thermonuclease family protein [Bradyrhizobium symbiodeficiens]
MRVAVVILSCVFALSPAIAGEVKGVPVIVDADTVYEGNIKIRLSGIDAPETDQICLDSSGKAWDCGIEAREKLKAYVREQSWTCELTGQDVYRRHLGSCTVASEDVSRWLVRNGWALAFRKYSMAYVADEAFAREQKRGLWSGAFVAPWEWRHRSNSTVILGSVAVPVQAQRMLMAPAAVAEPPSPNCVIKGNLKSAHQCIYHVPGGRFYDRLSMDRNSSRRWFCSVADAEAAGCRKSKL